MTALDYGVIAGYLLAALGVGIAMTRGSSASSEAYFVGGRRFPWWLAGTSMAATTFAADTPLAVCGLVAKSGIAGNWVWWSWGIAHVLCAVVFARYWRRLKVMTNAEVLERRYSGRPAAALRVIKAAYESLLINCLTMGWVILAMRKVVTILFPTSDPIAVTLSLVGIAVFYSLLGGIRSVVLTDLVQFALAMLGAVLLAVSAIGELGGLEGLRGQLTELYGDRADGLVAFVPTGDLPDLPLSLFFVLVTVGWWQHAEGAGYIVQRMSSVRSVGDADRSAVWFAVLHNAVRPWPWILVALAALVIWPLDQGSCSGGCPTGYACLQGRCALPDREATYAMLMVRSLPPGLLGLMVTSMLAAFMSTIDTHVNWGSSYIVSDLWQRFVSPDASARQLVRVGRVSVVLMAGAATAASFAMTSISAVWMFVIALGSGLGSVAIARWLWWRVSAAAEIAALSTSVVVAIGIAATSSPTVFGWENPLHSGELEQTSRILLVALSSLAIWVPTALLGPRTDDDTLRRFYEEVRPLSWGWRPVAASVPTAVVDTSALRLVATVIAVFGTLFGIGGLLLHTGVPWALLAAAGLTSCWWLLRPERG